MCDTCERHPEDPKVRPERTARFRRGTLLPNSKLRIPKALIAHHNGEQMRCPQSETFP